MKKQAEAEIEIKELKIDAKDFIPDQEKIKNSQSKFLYKNSAASSTPQTSDIKLQTNRPILQEQPDSSRAKMEMEVEEGIKDGINSVSMISGPTMVSPQHTPKRNRKV